MFAPQAAALDPERTLGQYKHTSWTADDGAPPIIFALAQGHDGYLWVGSATGLYRFDGVTFEPIPLHAPTANAWRVTALLAARDGAIWVGYSSGDIAVYRNGALRLEVTRPRMNAHVTGLAQTRDGAIWATFFNLEPSLLRNVGGRWTAIGAGWGLPPSVGGNMIAARDGSLWLMVDYGIYRLRPGARRFTHIGPHGRGAAISEDPAGRIWLSDSRGSRVLAGARATRGVYPTPRLTGWPSIARFDRDGNLWVLKGDGLFRVRAQEEGSGRSSRAGRVEPHFGARDGLTSDTIGAILEDREGNIWLGTTLGLDQLRPANVVVEPGLAGHMPDYGYGLISAADGSVYVGMANAVYRIRPGGRPQRVVGAIRSADQICEGADGNIWVFTANEILRIRGDEVVRIAAARPASYTHKHDGCAVDDHGRLWLNATSGGMFRIDAAMPVLRGAVNSGEWALTLVEGRGRTLLAWLNTGRLARLDHEGRPGETLYRRRPADVLFLHQGRRDLILGGVFGLGRLRGDTLQTIGPERFPWLAEMFDLVQTPEGETWMIGTAGFVRVSTAQLERAFDDPSARLRPLILGTQDGIPNVRTRLSQHGVVRGGDGRLWFATIGNIVWVDPARLHRNPLPPPVRIRAVVANGVRFRDPDRLALAQGTSSLAIQYTGLSLAVPQRVRFRYRLEGVDEHWVDAGARREAFYTNLGAGTYRFRVLAANNDGVWNMTGATLDLTIAPTFVQSNLFKILCAGLVVLLLWLAHRLRIRHLTSRLHMQFEARVAERKRIARDLHDTLLQGFQAVILFVQSAASRAPADTSLKLALERALDRATAALKEGRDRVRQLRSEMAEENLGEALRFACEDIVGEGPIQSRVAVAGAPRALHHLVSEETLHIAEEAVRNAVSHAGATTIDVALGYGDRDLCLRISDDGAGIPDDILLAGRRDGHFGLVGMRERAAQIGGAILIDSDTGRGTTVELRIPARAAYRSAPTWLGRLVLRQAVVN